MQEKTDEKKRGDQKYRGLTNAMQETGLTLKGAQQQTVKLQGELQKHADNLEQENEKGRKLQGSISAVQTSIRAAEGELDVIIAEQERLRKEHFAALDRNKALNGEIDQVLALIAECELVNRELVDEIQLFSEQDKQARSMLDRGETMREIVDGALRKAALTEEPIRHLKC